ncbi:Antibiotic biosynthesis monooxygenase [compost metagenome]
MYLIFATMFLTYNTMSAQKKDMMVRLSEIEIYPEYLSEYKAILKEESSASVKLEPGVLAIFPMYQKNDSTQVRIIEIYIDNNAYQSHLKTPHFQKYKTTTIKMVKSLKLVDMKEIDPESMKILFRKMIE